MRRRYLRRRATRNQVFIGSAVAVGLLAAGTHGHVPVRNVTAAHVAGGSNEALANQMAASGYGWTGSQTTCLDELWTEESGFRADALNQQSGAFGIPQALPASKMASAGADWQTNPATQIRWGLGYVAGRYGTPCAAWAFETSHTPNWY